MCYHVPYADREAINNPEKVLEIEVRYFMRKKRGKFRIYFLVIMKTLKYYMGKLGNMIYI